MEAIFTDYRVEESAWTKRTSRTGVLGVRPFLLNFAVHGFAFIDVKPEMRSRGAQGERTNMNEKPFLNQRTKAI